MDRALRLLFLVAATGVVTALSGCVSSPGGQAETVATVGDYPHYQSIDALERDADLIVEVILGESRYDVMLPDNTSDDPLVNPYAGTDQEPPLDDGAVPITVYSTTVTAVHHGGAAVGDVIDVKQMGGVVDGVTYEADTVASLSGHTSLLLFLATYSDSPASILGGSTGAFQPQDDTFTSLGDTSFILTADQVNALR